MDGHPTFRRDLGLTAAVLVLGLTPAGASLRDDRPGRAEVERMERGYYERLLDSGRRLDAPAEPRAGSGHAPFQYGRLAVAVDDLREYALKPGLATTHRGASWTTNALGLRDREYELTKPLHTVRFALLGDSIGTGWGVDDGLGFEPLAERALDERSRAAGGPAVEIWNVSVPGHAPGQRWEDFVRLPGPTAVDLVIYEATPADPGWDERRLRALLPRGLGWDAPQYRDSLARAGVRPGGTAESYARALRPYRWEILENVYRTIAAECRARGVPTLWILIPRVGHPADPSERARLVDLARRSGFTATADFSDAFDGLDPASLAIAPDDHHPKAEGHARLARRLVSALAEHPEWIGGEARRNMPRPEARR
jgi:hypothetical protein